MSASLLSLPLNKSKFIPVPGFNFHQDVERNEQGEERQVVAHGGNGLVGVDVEAPALLGLLVGHIHNHDNDLLDVIRQKPICGEEP